MPKKKEKEKDEVILIRVKPETVRKLQEDVVILKEKVDKLEKLKP